MQISEKELENFIYNGFVESNHKVTDIFPRYSRIYRQLEIKGYGITDIITLDVDIEGFPDEEILYVDLSIIELKIGKLKYDHIGQIMRYKTAIDRIIYNYRRHRKIVIEARYFLIVEDIDESNDLVFVLNALDCLNVIKYNYGLDGISFEWVGHGWRCINESFVGIRTKLRKDIKGLIRHIINKKISVEKTQQSVNKIEPTNGKETNR